jgi:peroxiredoxin
LGGLIVAISPETAAFSAELRAGADADFSVLTDIDAGYALSLNLAVWVDDAMSNLMSGAGVDLPRYQGNASWIIPIPATFVVGRDGVVAARHVNPDYRERAAHDLILGALRSLV